MFIHSDRDTKCVRNETTNYKTVTVEGLFIENEGKYENLNFCFLLDFQWVFY